MRKCLALLVVAGAALLIPAAATPSDLPQTPANCYPDPAAPLVDIYHIAYFMGETRLCGGHAGGNSYHYSAKVVDAQSGQVLGVWNGLAYGDHDFDVQFDPVWCMKANGTGRYVFSHLWIKFGSTERSRNSPSVQCRRQGGGTAPDPQGFFDGAKGD